MNQEDIIRMAREADGHMNSHAGGIDMTWEGIERFAALVAAAAKAEEREACAKGGLLPAQQQEPMRIYDYVWPQRKEHKDECIYACSYTPAQHLARGELLAVVHPSQLKSAYLQREGEIAKGRLDSPPNVPTARASKPWVGLTDEEMRDLEKQFNAERVRTSDEEYLVIYPGDYWAWQRAIEAKLREKNA